MADWCNLQSLDGFLSVARFGDLLEIDRSFYKHWVLYMGYLGDIREEVDAHYFDQLRLNMIVQSNGTGPQLDERTVLVMEFITNGSLGVSTSNVGFAHMNSMQKVIREDLFRINNEFSDMPPKSADEIILCILQYLSGDHEDYNLAFFNCEHACRHIRYGCPQSNQVRKTIGTAVAGLSALGIAWCALPALL